VDVVDRIPDDFGPLEDLSRKPTPGPAPRETGEYCFVSDVKDEDGEMSLSSMLDLPFEHLTSCSKPIFIRSRSRGRLYGRGLGRSRGLDDRR